MTFFEGSTPAENISLPDRIVENISSLGIKLDLLKKKCFAFHSVSTEQMIDPLIELDRIYYESYYHYSTVHDAGNNSKGILQPIDYLSVYDRCLTLRERLRENRAKFFNQLSKSCRKKKAIELSYNLVKKIGIDLEWIKQITPYYKFCSILWMNR